MSALVGVVQGASKSKKGPARGDLEETPEKPKGFPRGTLVRITVPLSPKPAEADTKELVVYLSKPGVIFVEAADLPWLLHYMYEENQGKRVPEPIDDDGADDDESVALEEDGQAVLQRVSTAGPQATILDEIPQLRLCAQWRMNCRVKMQQISSELKRGSIFPGRG